VHTGHWGCCLDAHRGLVRKPCLPVVRLVFPATPPSSRRLHLSYGAPQPYWTIHLCPSRESVVSEDSKRSVAGRSCHVSECPEPLNPILTPNKRHGVCKCPRYLRFERYTAGPPPKSVCLVRSLRAIFQVLIYCGLLILGDASVVRDFGLLVLSRCPIPLSSNLPQNILAAIIAPEERNYRKNHRDPRLSAQFAGFVTHAPMTNFPWRSRKLTLSSGQFIFNKAMFAGNGRRLQHV
jgi:hypothetical protein